MRKNNIIELLKEESLSLEKIIEQAKKDLRYAPEGSVQIRKHKKGIQFYHYAASKGNTGKYMPAKEQKKAAALVQKRYLTRLIDTAVRQQKILDLFLEKYDPEALKNVFSKENRVRQEIIKPVVLPDSLYSAIWENTEYEKKPFQDDTPAHYTQKNERVRSKSEVLIADALYRSGIPYRYECPLKLGNHVIHPDFTVLRISDRKTLFWEHLGLIDDPDYCGHALQKIELYSSNGLFPGDQLILTAENSKLPLNSTVVDRTIRHFIL